MMNKKLLLTVSLVAFFASGGFALANLAQVELQPQSSFTCNATGTIYYSLSNNQLMLCTSGSGASPVLTSSGSGGTSANFSSLTVSGTTTLATNGTSLVGIGTTNPSQKLEVDGNVLVQNTGHTYLMVQRYSTGYDSRLGFLQSGTLSASNPQYYLGYAFNNTSNNLFLGRYTGSATTQDITFATNGNVGIGTTTPTTAGLVVAANVSGAAVDVNNNRIINVGTPINAADAATKSYVDSAVSGGSGSGNLSTLTVSGTTTLATNGTSFVGIGTATPGSRLDVKGNIQQDGSGGYSTWLGRGGDITGGWSATPNAWTITPNRQDFAIGGWSKTSGSWTGPWMYINSDNGNVGIGTASPGAKLDVWGADVTPQQAGIQITSPNFPQLLFNASSGGTNAKIWRIIGRGTNDFEIQTLNDSYAGEVTAMQINRSGTSISNVVFPNGNVGIGTASPSTNLDVNGNINASIYYDRDNTSFYLDPAANVMPYSAVFAGSAVINGNLIVGGNDNTVLDMKDDNFGFVKKAGDSAVLAAGNGYAIRLGIWSTGTLTGNVSSGIFTEVMRVTSNDNVGIGTISPNYKLSVAGSLYSVEVDNGTATGATTIDWSKSNTQTLVLGASPIALTFTNGQPGGHYTLALKQDATGSRLVTWPGNVRWSSGVAPTLTTTANKTDYIEFVYDGLSSTFDGVGFNANF